MLAQPLQELYWVGSQALACACTCVQWLIDGSRRFTQEYEQPQVCSDDQRSQSNMTLVYQAASLRDFSEAFWDGSCDKNPVVL